MFGALPAWRFTRNGPQEALRAGSHTVTEGRRGLRLREGLIGLEVGLSAALLIVAGLLATSLTRLLQVDKGFDVDHGLTVDINLTGAGLALGFNCDRATRQHDHGKLAERMLPAGVRLLELLQEFLPATLAMTCPKNVDKRWRFGVYWSKPKTKRA